MSMKMLSCLSGLESCHSRWPSFGPFLHTGILFKSSVHTLSDWSADIPRHCIMWDSTDSKEIKPVNLKGNQPWIFIGRTDVEAEALILWPPDVKSWLIGKDPDAGKDWRQKEKGMTEDEMVGWHHGLNGRESEWTPGVGDGQGGLVGCSPWDHEELDTTERLHFHFSLSCIGEGNGNPLQCSFLKNPRHGGAW